MYKKALPGISAIEIIIVLAISTMMFVVAIGFFGTRTRTAQDDAARLVVSEIAKVRNEAQQGLGPSTPDGAGKVAGSELFGQAIEYNNDQMVVYKLMKTSSGKIKPYETYSIALTQQLAWWVNPAVDCTTFSSCYDKPKTAAGYVALSATPVNLAGNNKIITVFRNNTGQSYVFARDVNISNIGNDSFMGEASNSGNYTADRQGQLRLAYAVPGDGADEAAKFANAPVQYYVMMDLSIPNDQQFEVVK